MLFTNAPVSPQGQVNQADINKWIHNTLVFLIPLLGFYLLQVYATVQKGPLTQQDLIPTPATIGAMELFIINTLVDLYRKFMDGTK